jgi:hypothetical protein
MSNKMPPNSIAISLGHPTSSRTLAGSAAGWTFGRRQPHLAVQHETSGTHAGPLEMHGA